MRVYQQDPSKKAQYFSDHISRWHFNLYQRSETASHWSPKLGFGSTLQIFPFCQPEEMSVLSQWELLLKISGFNKKNRYRSQKNWVCERLAWYSVSPQYLGFSKLC